MNKFSEAWSWRLAAWTAVLGLAWAGGCQLFDAGCNRWRVANDQHAPRARTARFLEPTNDRRRAAGLALVGPALAVSRYGLRDAVLEALPARRWRPYVLQKLVVFPPSSPTEYANQPPEWEKETVVLVPSRQAGPMLTRDYWYTAPHPRYAWNNVLVDRQAGRPRYRSLTRAQADSVLAYWKAQGARDSLAAVRR